MPLLCVYKILLEVLASMLKIVGTVVSSTQNDFVAAERSNFGCGSEW